MPPHVIRPDAFAQTIRTFPVNSSAPQHSTSTRPRQKHRPPTTRCTANGMLESLRKMQKYMPPNAMNAPANTDRTRSFDVAMVALPTPSASAFASTSAGDSASGFNGSRSSRTMLMHHPSVQRQRRLRADVRFACTHPSWHGRPCGGPRRRTTFVGAHPRASSAQSAVSTASGEKRMIPHAPSRLHADPAFAPEPTTTPEPCHRPADCPAPNNQVPLLI